MCGRRTRKESIGCSRALRAQTLTDVVDGAIIAAQQQEGASRVAAGDGNHVLHLDTAQGERSRPFAGSGTAPNVPAHK